MIYFLENEEHLILLPNYMTVDLFIDNAKVEKDSYIGRILEKIYIALTVPKFDLIKDYEMFFKLEYENFLDFLYKKYPLLTDTDLQDISLKLEDKDISIYRGFFKRLNDYNITSLLEQQDGLLKKIISFLHRPQNEN